MLARRMFPTATFEDLHHEMDRVFDAFTRRADNGLTSRARVFPPVNVWEDHECLFVEAEVPGLTLDDLELQVVGNELTIKGRRSAMEGEKLTYHRRERGIGEFSRFVTLPIEVNAEKVDAVLQDGVLTITLPKAEAARARKITVKPG